MPRFCSHCDIVEVTDSHSDLCQGCIYEILSWLFWEDYTESQELSDHLERMSQEFDYQRSFCLVLDIADTL